MSLSGRPLAKNDGDLAFRTETLRKLAIFVGIISAALSIIMYLDAPSSMDVWSALLIAAVSFLVVFLIHIGRPLYTAHILGFGAMGAAIFGIYSFGSVRSVAAFIFVAAVAGFGSLLGFRALLVSIAISVVSLGVLAWAELQGWLPTPNMQVGLKVWATQSTCLLVVAALVYFSRRRSDTAWQHRLEELETRKAIEQERDRALDRSARIFRFAPSPMIAQAATTGEILDVNPAFEACYGYTREQILGRTDECLWALPDQRAAHVQKLREQTRIHRAAAIGLRADGERFEGRISSEIGLEDEEHLVITTVSDETDQNEVLKRLLRSEERFSKAFNFSPLHLVITRLQDDIVIEMNRNEGIAGAPKRSDAKGLPAAETGPWFKPEDREGFVQRLASLGHLHAQEVSMTRPDGSTLDAKIWAEQIDIDDVPCMLSCIVDVSEEKRREAQLLNLAHGMASHTGHAFFAELAQTMAKTMGADMVSVGELSNSCDVNTLAVWLDGAPAPNFTYSLEGTPCKLASGQHDLCVYPDQVDALFPSDLALVEGKFKAYVGQSLRDPSGKTVGVLVALWHQPLDNPVEATALMAICAGRANAELLRLQRDREVQNFNETLEQRVHSRTIELHKLNAELDSFAYSISHDLKTPLRAIDGFTQLLSERLDGRLDDEERHLMARVLGATHRMATLMADLLALTHVSQQQINHERLNLSMIAQEELTRCLEKHPRANLRTRIELGLVAHADARLARIVLKNLLENAVKYTRDQAAPMIEVGRIPLPSGADHQAPGFFVRDNGAGFETAHADKLFKPFQSLHMPSAGFEGSGMGLATVRRIIERHNGSLHAEAVVGQGATVFFSFGPPPLSSGAVS
ncbi:PAS domain-containing sensor histidine kinase [Hydrogenophaga sp. PAMC20947]|uniref:PAS domain-containing sensor histidine kinase n=1 Tax=Hydrogenophaga sp. PAMC20947 TaxID=2565558 RepID=UPI00109DA256|nr:PAS domain-containing sensor histidine kinase [Hydrogenophaga sp. PAMC20947]QCB45919.1 PAS domain-containing sensor histidine kinase [Hydrogenophaga sp. PAMC20947]